MEKFTVNLGKPTKGFSLPKFSCNYKRVLRSSGREQIIQSHPETIVQLPPTSKYEMEMNLQFTLDDLTTPAICPSYISSDEDMDVDIQSVDATGHKYRMIVT